MKTKIRFGMALDGVRWSKKPASIGEITCGPKGLLQFLETQLGLTGAETAAADRVSQYKAKIAAADCEWCRASFALDPWGTAKNLLALRDELRELGWTPDIGGSRRFEALGAIERTDVPLGVAFGDRMNAVLSSERKIEAEMTVVDGEADYPPVWKNVLNKFFPDRVHESNLGENGKPEIIVVTAPNEVMLAHDFVRYLAAKPDENGNVAVIANGDTTLLDGLLHRAGLPAIGNSNSSAEREALQILPLWIENMWAPFSPGVFMQLLGIAGSPVPEYVRRALVDALKEAPGIGGERWKSAWDKIYERIASFDNPEVKREKAEELRALFEGERFDPDGAGIPTDALTRRLDILKRHIATRVAGDQIWKLVLKHIKDFERLAADMPSLRRVDVSRMLDTIYGIGTNRESSCEEVSPYKIVGGPGQIMDDADTVLWWGFTDCSGAGTYWSPAECAAMAKAGMSLSEDAALSRELQGWENAYAHARKRLICFAPETVGGAEAALHPFGVNLEAKKFPSFRKIQDRELFNFESGTWTLADRSTQLVKRPQYGKSAKGGPAALPKNDIAPKSLSVTQLETLISCPFRWILEKHVGLRDAEIAQLPAEKQALGTLAHHIVEILSSPGEEDNREPERAEMRAGELFDELLPKEFAEMLLPENTDKRIRYREQLTLAVGALFGEIKKRGLSIEAPEMRLESVFEGVPFTGFADLVLKDADGRSVVYDFKWSRNKRYRDSVKDGLSIQLAFYAWLLSPDAFDVSSAYFQFPLREFVRNNQDNKAAFNRAVEFYRHRIEDIRSGRVDWGVPMFGTSETYPALSAEETAQIDACEDPGKAMKITAEICKTRLPNACPAKCEYCGFQSLCGLAKPIEENEEEVEVK